MLSRQIALTIASYLVSLLGAPSSFASGALDQAQSKEAAAISNLYEAAKGKSRAEARQLSKTILRPAASERTRAFQQELQKKDDALMKTIERANNQLEKEPTPEIEKPSHTIYVSPNTPQAIPERPTQREEVVIDGSNVPKEIVYPGPAAAPLKK